MADYTAALGLEPTYADAYFNRATVKWELGDWDGALEDYSRAAEVNPADASIFSARGLVWKEKREDKRAMADFDEALRLDPDNDQAYNNRAILWRTLQEYERAMADYDRAIALNPGKALYYSNRAVTHMAMGNYEDAIGDLEAALESNDQDALAHNNLAWICATCPRENLRDGARAVENATLANQLCDGQEPAFLGTLAAAYAELGDFDAAVRWQKKALKLAPAHERDDKYRDKLELFQSGLPFRESITVSCFANRR
jgi:tetratricopeptide (TPR) repeat protein